MWDYRIKGDGATATISNRASDVLALNAPPPADATTADLRVLATKQSDCKKGDVVKVELTDLQEMHNRLLSNINKGMPQMMDHPGQGGL